MEYHRAHVDWAGCRRYDSGHQSVAQAGSPSEAAATG